MKTNELQGAALDLAVAKCLLPDGWNDAEIILGDDTDYSTNWALAGPIIELEEISIERDFNRGAAKWACWTPAPVRQDTDAFGYGPTPLIAAMRCYVASKLGDEINILEVIK